MNERISVPENEVHAGALVDAESRHVVPVEGNYYPWLQGQEKPSSDNYAEFVHIGGHYSKFADKARRIKVQIVSEFDNFRRYNDWKGYDEIEPQAWTRILFNDQPVGKVRGWGSDILRHLLQVERYIDEIQNLPAFGWWSEEELRKEVGRQVDYDGYPAVIVDVLNFIQNGEIMVFAPSWPDDGYDRGGMLRTPINYGKLDWFPDPNRPAVEVPGRGEEEVEGFLAQSAIAVRPDEVIKHNHDDGDVMTMGCPSCEATADTIQHVDIPVVATDLG